MQPPGEGNGIPSIVLQRGSTAKALVADNLVDPALVDPGTGNRRVYSRTQVAAFMVAVLSMQVSRSKDETRRIVRLFRVEWEKGDHKFKAIYFPKWVPRARQPKEGLIFCGEKENILAPTAPQLLSPGNRELTEVFPFAYIAKEVDAFLSESLKEKV